MTHANRCHSALIALGCLAIFGWGCGDGAMDPGDAQGDSTPAVVAGQVTLTASDARERSGDAQKTSYQVIVTIANGLADAISVAPGLFRLRAGDLEYLAAAETTGGCPSDSLLAAGGTIACALKFVVATADAPSAVVMTTPIGTAEATTRPVACARCDGFCTDLMSSESNCGACNVRIPLGGSCVEGVPTCPDGRFECNTICEPVSRECALESLEQRTPSCQARCAAIGAACVSVEALYACGDQTLEVHPGVGCDDVPPPTLDACGAFASIDCRCRHL